MKTCAERRARSAQLLLCLLVFFSLIAAPGAAAADPPPYVFVVFDNSTTMAMAPVCTHVDAVLDPDPFDGACTTVCPLGDPKCAALCPDYGCSQYDEADLPDPAAMAPIVVDNLAGAPAFTSLLPPSANSHPNNYDPSDDTFDDSSATADSSTNSAYRATSSAAQRFTFTPTLTHAGLWHVFAFWGKDQVSGSTNARFEINYHDGSVVRTKYLEVDQQNYGNGFVFLATLDFRASGGGIPASVVIRNTNEANQLRSNGTIVADAVAFVPVPVTPAEPTCLEQAYLCRQPLCPHGDCNTRLAGDDPTSKFFQAKQALHEELAAADPLQAGFGSFNQDNARVMFKHWAYRVSSGTSPVFNFADGSGTTVPFPAPGSIDIFGTGAPYDANGRNLAAEINGFHCASSITPPSGSASDSEFVGCRPAYPADVRDLWDMERLRRIPKLGKTGTTETSLFVRSWNGSTYQVYRIDWEPVASPDKLGDATFDVQFDVTRCNNLTADPNCTLLAYTTALVSNAAVQYQLVSDTIPVNLDAGRSGPALGYFRNQMAVKADNLCAGLEPNEDWVLAASPSADDMFASYAFKHPATADTRGDFDPLGTPIAHVPYFDRGDFLPLDWTNGQIPEVLGQLAPNDVAGYSTSASTPPDYRSATYFHDENLSVDSPANLNRFLRLRDDVYQPSPSVWAPVATPPLAHDPNQRPLVAFANTPIYRSLRDFKDWYEQWRLYAALADADWADRRKYLLLITDGEESCDTQPVATPPLVCQTGNDIEYLADILPADSQLETFAVGYGGLTASADLTCIAAEGKTGAGHTVGVPRLAHDVEALKAELAAIFAQMTAP